MADIGSTDITTTQIRNTLGEDNNNVGLLCRSSKVNPWQGNGVDGWTPGISKEFYVDSNKLVQYQNKNPYKMGYFKYYDHDAPKPEVTQYESGTVRVDPGTTYDFTIEVQMSSLDWAAALSADNVDGFYLIINDNNTLDRVSTDILDLTTDYNQQQIYNKSLGKGDYEFIVQLGGKDGVTEHIADFPSQSVKTWNLVVEEKNEPEVIITYKAFSGDYINSISDNGTSVTAGSDIADVRITVDMEQSISLGTIDVKKKDLDNNILAEEQLWLKSLNWDGGTFDYDYLNETLPFTVEYDTKIEFICYNDNAGTT